MSEVSEVKMVFKNAAEGKTSVGKPRKGWLDEIENYVKKMGVRGWRRISYGRNTSKLILKEARVLHGL